MGLTAGSRSVSIGDSDEKETDRASCLARCFARFMTMRKIQVFSDDLRSNLPMPSRTPQPGFLNDLFSDRPGCNKSKSHVQHCGLVAIDQAGKRALVALAQRLDMIEFISRGHH